MLSSIEILAEDAGQIQTRESVGVERTSEIVDARGADAFLEPTGVSVAETVGRAPIKSTSSTVRTYW